jgi:hypothetical protein
LLKEIAKSNFLKNFGNGTSRKSFPELAKELAKELALSGKSPA